MTARSDRKEKDGWISYGIECKGILVEVLGQWKIIFKEAVLRKE